MKRGTDNNMDMRIEAWKLLMLTILLSLSMMFLPPLGIFINSFTPFPLILICYLFGRTAVALAVGGVAILLTLVVGMEFGLLFIVQYGVMAFLVGDLARRDYEWNRIMLVGTIVPILFGGLLIFLYASGSEQNLITTLQTMVADNMRESLKVYANIGINFGQQIIGEEEIIALSETMVMLIPSILTVGAIVSVVINSLMAHYLVAKRYGTTLFKRIDIGLWEVPDNLIWVIIGGGAIIVLFSDPIRIMGLNAIIVMSALYLLQGISITIFLFRKWGLHTLVRVAIYGIMLSQPIFLALTAVVGIANIWIDFRKIRGNVGSV